MKKYNEKLIESSKIISQNTLRKSKVTVDRLTHPSKRVSRIGSAIGRIIGIGLICTGAVEIFLGSSAWGIGSLIAGATTIASNSRYMKK